MSIDPQQERTQAKEYEVSAEGLAKAALYAVIFFSASVALIHLGIGEEIVEAAFVVGFGATALAFGLAFGLGPLPIIFFARHSHFLRLKPNNIRHPSTSMTIQIVR